VIKSIFLNIGQCKLPALWSKYHWTCEHIFDCPLARKAWRPYGINIFWKLYLAPSKQSPLESHLSWCGVYFINTCERFNRLRLYLRKSIPSTIFRRNGMILSKPNYLGWFCRSWEVGIAKKIHDEYDNFPPIAHTTTWYLLRLWCYWAQGRKTYLWIVFLNALGGSGVGFFCSWLHFLY
jgi:hypothetical protein